MLFFLMEYFRSSAGIKFPSVFGYTSTRMILAALTSLALSIFLGPWFIRKLNALKIGQHVRQEECPELGKLHKQKADTPTMGGILILFSIVISLILWMDPRHIFTLILLVTTVVLGALGARDDYLKLRYKNSKGLSAKKKLFVQLLLSGGIALYLFSTPVQFALEVGDWFQPPVVKERISPKVSWDPFLKEDLEPVQSTISMSLSTKDYAGRVYFPFVKDPIIVFSGIFSIFAVFFMMCVITGASNAVNLTDGLDGLASGCLIMVAICLLLIAFLSNNIDIAGYLNILYIEGSGEIAVYLSALAGACLGFLWYNSYPAQVFMGDTGSLALGGVIGVSAVLLKKEFLLAIVGGIFVAEALSVIIQVASFRYRHKKRVFLCTPLHHHFEYLGWPESKIVVRFWIVGLLLALLGIASLKFQ